MPVIRRPGVLHKTACGGPWGMTRTRTYVTIGIAHFASLHEAESGSFLPSALQEVVMPTQLATLRAM